MSALLGPAAVPAAVQRPPRVDLLHWTLAALAAVLAWDLSGLDLVVLQWVSGPDGSFAWRDHVLTRRVLHDGGRLLGVLVLLLLAVNVWRPLVAGPGRAERVHWLLVTLLCMVAVPALKQISRTSCPWDLAGHGGVASLVSHWDFTLGDGGPGRCFPSGHATAAFGFFAGWFVLRRHRPGLARVWLAGVLTAGALFGGAQVLRGAHHASHVLWTAWLCWALSAALLAIAPRRQRSV